MNKTFPENKDKILKGKTLVLYDGVCGLCNGFVKFLLHKDKEGQLLYASLQSEFAATLTKEKNIDSRNLQTVFVITNYSLPEETIRDSSDAAIEALTALGGLYVFLKWCRIFPKSWRDAIYNLIAQNRYKIFGKKESCMLPDPAQAARFVDI